MCKQKRIQNPVEHVIWSYLRGSEYAFDMSFFYIN